MYIIGISLIGLSLLIRAIKFRKFLKSITKVCHIYDWKHVDENGDLLLEIIKDDYWEKSEWSAYNFLYLKVQEGKALRNFEEVLYEDDKFVRELTVEPSDELKKLMDTK